MLGWYTSCRRLTTCVPLLLIGGMITICMIGLINLNGNLLADRKEKAKAVVDATLNNLEKLYDQSKNGEISEEEAKKLALMLVNNMRFEKNNYVWLVNNLNGIVISNPGIPLSKTPVNITDYLGLNSSIIISETARNGGGFVNYRWHKEKQEKLSPKISYVALFKPWDWIVGSGIYIDDVEAVFFRNAAITGSVSLIIIVIVWIGAHTISKNLYNPLGDITTAINRFAEGDKSVFIPHTEKKGEIGDLARTFEKFKNNSPRINSNIQPPKDDDNISIIMNSKESIDPFV